MRTIEAADLFCGAGGTSSGAAAACKAAGIKLNLLAVNHWDTAIATHSKNHPTVKHLCVSLDNVNPRDVVPSGRLDLLLASPECQHHSNARGGKPMGDQSRASAWHILRWAEALYIENILIENVKEFQTWGPLGANGRPLKSKRGQTFTAFIESLKSLGYNVEFRVMNAANYGDATTRERLFIQARRKRRVSWPEPTHAATPEQARLFGESQKKWRAAREIIDWSIPGKDIAERKKPLAAATMARIAAGLVKFGGVNAEPFLVLLRRNGGAMSVEKPVPTVTAGGNHIGLCEPFVLGQQSGGAPRSVDGPLPTIATDGAIALVEPFITEFRGNHSGKEDGTKRNRSLDEPLPTQDCSPRFGLVEPFIIPFFGEREGQSPRTHSISDPLPTVTSHGAGALVEPFVISMEHGGRDHSIDKPMPTITSADGFAVVEPFMVKYFGTAGAVSVDEPLDTITAKDRFGLVEPGAQYGIRFRMLQPKELAAAMSFPENYWFAGSREDQVRQIGNAVAVKLSTALCLEILGDRKTRVGDEKKQNIKAA